MNRIVFIALMGFFLGSILTIEWYIHGSLTYLILVETAFLCLFSIVTLYFLFWQIYKSSAARTIESEARFKKAFDHSPIGLAIISLQGKWQKVNQALCKIVGYTEAELLNMDFKSITYPDDIDEGLENIKQLYKGEIADYQIEKRYISKDKKVKWVLVTASLMRDENKNPLYFIAHVQDIDDKKKKEQELSYQAYYDTLTGLVNRNQLEQSLDMSISSALNRQQKFAVFFLDIDYFKKINDVFGHDTGDQVLKVIGDRLRKSVRSTDIAARIGGDEFILVLQGTDNPEIAALFAEKITSTLLMPITVKEHQFFITTSIGISFYPGDGTDYKMLMKSADAALYKAKEQGRNTYQFCTPEINKEIKEKIMFKQAIQTALNNAEFQLEFLPKLNLVTQAIVGFEALLRWKSEIYGNVSPTKIIPLAEDMGLITKLSNWIIKSASEQTKSWQALSSSRLKLAINISPRHYMQSGFVESILAVLESTQFPAHYLQLEIPENLIMQDPDYSLQVVRALKKNGIEIIIDNFGTGYSSLNYLQQFSVDYIKIDRQFTQSILLDSNKVELLRVMILLAKSLNIKILAEGVESEKQYDLLLNLGCDEIQGYYISPPIPIEKVPIFLKTPVT